MVVYMTINLINGKRYIGADTKNNPNYIGSGTLLIKAVKKYGKSNFRKVILEEVSNQKELRDREIYWVTYYNAANRSDFYNMSKGGQGGVEGKSVWNNGLSIKDNPKMYNKMYTNRNRPNYDYITEEWKKSHSNSILSSEKFQKNKNKKVESRKKSGNEWHSEKTKMKIGDANRGRIKTESEIIKRKQTIKERGSLSGPNNPASISVIVMDTLTNNETVFACKKDVITKYGVTYYELSKKQSSDGRYIFKY